VPEAPALPLAGRPRVPQMPQVPAVPSVSDVPDGVGSALQTAAADVPMREMVFPSPAPLEAPAPAPAAAAGGGGDGGGGGAGAGAGAGASSTELDDLAHKLYDRIRWRLRSELRLDMERSGLGAGVRR
jgi:hypothetical protein